MMHRSIATVSPRRLAPHRQGSVLLLVLVVVAILSLGANTYLDLMQTEHRAVRRHGRADQARRLSESGAEYVRAFLGETPTRIAALGGLAANSTYMQSLLAAAQDDPFARGRFTILAPAQLNGLYAGVRYGLEDESAKLNLHVLLAPGAEQYARDRLLALPNMTPDIADAILDWLDADAMPREYGAEAEHYRGLTPPYEPRNGPIAALDELLLVRGVTPELLYGLDQNRNLLVDDDELPRGALQEADMADGAMNRGWAAYLTLHSVENLAGSALAPRIDLNGNDLQALYNALKSTLTDEQAKFIVLYRQHGAPAASAGQQPGGD
ncbi:MAG TPA: type II secretion system protein GspK, partial [Lacipirellulaceae bacterium]|nr:type II secretion system protein GspK [Lacipirellulaceae bacterium]